MAQTIKINGVTYNDVKEMKAPLASDTTKNAVFVETSDATAKAASIKGGETAYIDGVKVEGTMPVNETVGGTLDASNPSVTIPAGYTPGGEVVIQPETKSITPSKTAQDVTPDVGKVLTKVSIGAIPAEYITTTDANATADDIKNGKTAYVNGKKVTGAHTDPAFSLANGVLSIV